MIEFAIYGLCMLGLAMHVNRSAYNKGIADCLLYLEAEGLITLEEADEE